MNQISSRLLDKIKRPVEMPVTDLSYYIGAATWTLKEGMDLLATFKTAMLYNNDSDFLEVYGKCLKDVERILYNTLATYELEEKTFLISAHIDRNPSEPEEICVYCHDSKVYPDGFISWARDLSMPIPEDFYQKLMRAQERHALGRKIKGSSVAGGLSAKENRELGRLRREKENFDLAIKATVRAVQFCIKEGRRVMRKELFDLLCSGEESIPKETFERILPLLPPEYRKGPGAPSSDKIGYPDEPEIVV